MKNSSVCVRTEAKPVGMGLEIGAVSVKWVLNANGRVTHEILPHGGDPVAVVGGIFNRYGLGPVDRVVVTGQSATSLMDLPYRSETQCLEKAVVHLGLDPDILLSLGGETFSIYPMRDNVVKNIIATSKCAAGTGEFIVQQFQRMGMSLTGGISAAGQGRRVKLATRCSVHCKSDATHKLNKGECQPGDIARSLIFDLAEKVAEMVDLAQWPTGAIVISGGMVLNGLFVEHFRNRFPDSDVIVVDESPYLEAFGASLYAAELPQGRPAGTSAVFKSGTTGFKRMGPLREAENLLAYRAADERREIADGTSYILGVDAGSTTTKAVLLNHEDGTVGAACYLRTLGNPILATQKCLAELQKQVGDRHFAVIQAAATGSAREMVSVYLDNCLSFNEILAHARAAAAVLPDVDTVFEIGGQDSKYISFQNGIPVDYAMNEGCSAGTGSFLEESASVDMGIGVTDISAMALRSTGPIAFGERCAAFINTDVRNALQQGATREDVIAGLVYAIADNYISRIVGPRHVGENILFLGGVALNRAVALAMAARTRRKVMVPGHPELMGSVGAAMKAGDLFREGAAVEKMRRLGELIAGEMKIKGTFQCRSCENLCEVQQIAVRDRIYPYGGLCSKYDKERHGQQHREGRDFIRMRNRIMRDTFGPERVVNPRGTIGIPMALTAFELLPFYAKLVNSLGFTAVLSAHSAGSSSKVTAPICYPCELVHSGVDDLLKQGVDYILLPHVIDINDSKGAPFQYACPSTTVIPDIIRSAFPGMGKRILSPHITLSSDLLNTTLSEIGKMGAMAGLSRREARLAGETAIAHYRDFKKTYQRLIQESIGEVGNEPAVVVAGRPYVVCAPDVNLALPRKITSRGYHVISADMLPFLDDRLHSRDVWHFTRQISNAVAHVKQTPNLHICLVSCFSCGPDASMYHYIRRRLAGEIFCYLEIDSHTAHAGFETRLGAFIDIIEERRKKGKNHE